MRKGLVLSELMETRFPEIGSQPCTHSNYQMRFASSLISLT